MSEKSWQDYFEGIDPKRIRIRTIDPPRTEAEQFCYEMLSRLQRDFEREAKPYLDQLMRIHASRMPALYIEITPEGGVKLDVVELAKDSDA